MKRRNFVLCLVCTLAISSTAHAAEIRTVALSGQQAPGKPDGTEFTGFDGRPLVLNDAGQTAFAALLSDSNGYSVWSEGGGSLHLTASVGQQVPGLPDGVTYGGFPSPGRIVINDTGATAFYGFFSPSQGDAGLWSSGAGGSALIARSGEQAAGAPDGAVYVIDAYRPSLVLNDVGQAAFSALLAGGGVDFSSRDGIWAQRQGSLELVARTGSHAPGTPDSVNFIGFTTGVGAFALNNAGQTAFRAFFTPFPNQGIWSEGSGSLALVARTGSQAPGMPSGVNFSSFSAPALNSAGQTAFYGRVTGGGVDATNNTGIWSEASGSLALVARSGSPAPGTPSGVNFSSTAWQTPALNDAGQIAFFAGVIGADVDSTNDLGLWSGASGSLALVARKGDHPPGTEDGVVFRDFLCNCGPSPAQTLILNAAGQTAVFAQLAGGGISASNDFGIWATDSHGALQLIAREGDPLEVAPGDFRTVSFLTFLGDTYTYVTGNSDGRPSAFNNLGQLAFHASFTDGASGIFVSNRVAVPEPSALPLAALGLVALTIPRRRWPLRSQ